MVWTNLWTKVDFFFKSVPLHVLDDAEYFIKNLKKFTKSQKKNLSPKKFLNFFKEKYTIITGTILDVIKLHFGDRKIVLE